MISLKRVFADSPELNQVRSLYENAFPKKELMDFRILYRPIPDPHELYSIYDEEQFCGFISVIVYNGICNIIYFAICESLRSQGYGSRTLEALQRSMKDLTIILDVELDDPKSKNNVQRQKRKQFYLKNGYFETNVKYVWQGEKYEILSTRQDFTKKELDDFYRGVYPSRIDRILQKIKKVLKNK